MHYDIVVEDMGGDVQVVEISALYKKNLKKLQVFFFFFNLNFILITFLL